MRSTRRILLAVAAFVFVFSAVPAFGASYLSTVDFSSTTHGYLGGWYGTARNGFMSATNDGGATWHASLTGPSMPMGIGFSGSSSARAVSEYDDMVMSTEDAGATWARNTPIIGGGASFSDIAKSSIGYVAVGADPATTDGGVGVIYTSANGVSGWTQRFRGPIYPGTYAPNGDYTPGPATYAKMDKVAFAPDGLTGWAIGTEWTNATYSNATALKGLLIYKTVNGGSTWTTPAAIPNIAIGPMNDLVVVDTTHAYAVGPGLNVVQTVNGTNWSTNQRAKIGVSTLDGFGIDASDANHKVVVGYTSAKTGGVQWTTDGSTWTTGTVGAPAVRLRSVSMITATKWIVVGENETIGRTNNGGATWTWTTATPPKVSLTSPVTYDSASSSTRLVAGTSSDVGAGVATVEVSVLRDDGKYWNPDIGWIATQFWNSASTVSGWDTWGWNWAPDPTQVGAHSYAVFARATDAVGQSTTSVSYAITRSVGRIAGSDRYATAAALASKGWDPAGTKAWTGVKHIIIANGEPGKEPDPLTAAGLAGIYDAPVLTVQYTRLPSITRTIITEIAKKNPGVQIHIVGGTAVVPVARWNDMKKISGVSQTKDQFAGRDRYETSALIATRMVTETAKTGAAINGVILIAGDSDSAFYDALAASPIAYAQTMPMLSVQKTKIPTTVKDVLDSPALKDKPRYAASSTTYISTPAAGATRMTTSSNRYTAAKDIAKFAAIDRAWTSLGDTAIASKLPDALTGGAFLGRVGGVMLFTDSSNAIESITSTFITSNWASISDGWVVGGTSVIPTAQETSFRKLLNP